MPKRKSEPTAVESSKAPAAKKARKSDVFLVENLMLLNQEELKDASADELVSYVTALQTAYRELESKLRSNTSISAKPIENDPVKIAEKADKIANMMAAGIKKQMKWQPSCKRWAFESMVPSEAVFRTLFKLKEEKKAWKQKKIPVREFEEITGSIEARIRYAFLSIISEDVTLKWNKEALSFTVSGLYGL